MNILVLDPGESTGWLYGNAEGTKWVTGVVYKDLVQIENLFSYPIDIVIYETFQLYPGKAASLSWSTFYPVEIIGAIKLLCLQKNIPIIGQQPSVKKFSGWRYKDYKWKTEHEKDAYQHYCYYLRNKKRKC